MKHLYVKRGGRAGGLFYWAWPLAAGAGPGLATVAQMPLANNTSFIADVAIVASASVRRLALFEASPATVR